MKTYGADDSIIADAKAEEYREKARRTRDRSDIEQQIIGELMDGERWDELRNYLYDPEPDWLNEVLLDTDGGRLVVCALLKVHKPKWVQTLAEGLVEKEVGG